MKPAKIYFKRLVRNCPDFNIFPDLFFHFQIPCCSTIVNAFIYQILRIVTLDFRVQDIEQCNWYVWIAALARNLA